MICDSLFVTYETLEKEIRDLTAEHEKPSPALSKRAIAANQQFNTCLSAQPVITPVFNLNGTWLYGGKPGPVISGSGNRFSVNMSAYGRPGAVGIISSASEILVSFPDDDIYTGRLTAPHTIHWSNASTWTKA